VINSHTVQAGGFVLLSVVSCLLTELSATQPLSERSARQLISTETAQQRRRRRVDCVRHRRCTTTNIQYYIIRPTIRTYLLSLSTGFVECLITSATFGEVLFSPSFVRPSVCKSVNSVTQKSYWGIFANFFREICEIGWLWTT